MDFDDPWILMSSLVIGLVGLVLFNHGRKQADLRTLAGGVALCVYPYFVSSLVLVWIIFGVIAGGLWAWMRSG